VESIPIACGLVARASWLGERDRDWERWASACTSVFSGSARVTEAAAKGIRNEGRSDGVCSCLRSWSL
jgi:hypothetical protein